MAQVIDLIIGNEIHPVKLLYKVNPNGTIIYTCELNGIGVSTFRLFQKYEGATIEEALQKIANEILRAQEEYLEL